MKENFIKKTALLSLLIYTTHKVTLYFEKQRIKKVLDYGKTKRSIYHKTHR